MARRGWLLAGLIVLAALLFWLGLLAFAVDRARLPAEAAGRVIAVFPPRTPLPELILKADAAGAALVEGTWFENVWYVEGSGPGLVGRLEAAGAWAAFDPDAFTAIMLAGCVVLPFT